MRLRLRQHRANRRRVLDPKFTSDPFFVAANKGADEAAAELGIKLEFNGPVDANIAAQVDIVDRWVRRRVDAIAVSANDANALAPSMKRAMDAGIATMTWDADVAPTPARCSSTRRRSKGWDGPWSR